jgi:alpha-L-rhamnosidase
MCSSAEDSAVDSVRERGEWVGDASLAGAELMSVGWDNVTLMRRVLYHAAATAREDGLVAGCGPGELIYLGTYAAQWVSSCLRCAELEGSTELLADLDGPARRNIEALLACIDSDGKHHLPWGFVDWGYVPVKSEIEIPVLAHVVSALDAWVRWQKLLGREDYTLWQEKAERLRHIIRQAVAKKQPGYHAAVLGERIGAVDRALAVETTLQQLRSSFPCNPAAKRLRDPTKASPDVATPYFTNYSIDLLLRAGKTDEVLDIWRKAWGWMLDGGATTWWEVFDDRWSHCHYWAGAPTWQMSRRILGIDPTLHEGRPATRIAVYPGSLTRAEGRIALPGAGWADVSWRSDDEKILYKVNSAADWTLLKGDATIACRAGTTEVRLSATDYAFTP